MTYQEIRENYPEISLKKFCEKTNLCYQYILKVSKQPKAGEAYDATAFNFEAVQRIIDKHTELNLEEIDWAAIAEEAKQAKYNQPRVSKPEEFELGDQFTLRTSKDRIYEIIYVTKTHVVFIDEDLEQPRAMSWDTFMHQSPRKNEGVICPVDD